MDEFIHYLSPCVPCFILRKDGQAEYLLSHFVKLGELISVLRRCYV
jgi:hypothetical protein